MNFLAHFLLATQFLPPSGPLSAYVVGTALPDLLPLAAPRKRLRLASLTNAPEQTDAERALTAGARVHLLTDAAFHKTPAFTKAQTQVGELVTRAGFVGLRVRRFFLAHILVELALDAVLLRRQPHLTGDFYDAFAIVDFRETTGWAEAAIGQPLPSLSDVLTRFTRSRYLDSYAADAGVAEGVNRLGIRARQDAFTDENWRRLVSLASATIVTLTEQADVLLDETAAAVSAHYPPTTEK